MQQESMFEKWTIIFLFISSSAFLSIKLCIISIRWGMGQGELSWLSGRLLTCHFWVQFLCSKWCTEQQRAAGLAGAVLTSTVDHKLGLWTTDTPRAVWNHNPADERQLGVGTNPRIGMQSSPKRPCLHFLKVSKMGADQDGLNISLSLTKL